jgi:hypothetical protein
MLMVLNKHTIRYTITESDHGELLGLPVQLSILQEKRAENEQEFKRGLWN